MYIKRIQKLREDIKTEKLDAVFVSSVSNIEYLTGYSNFSKDEREAYIFLGENFGYIITDGRYSEAIKKEVPHLELFQRGQGKSTEDLLKKHKKEIKKLGIEEDNLTVLEGKFFKKHFKNIKHFSVDNLRSIKTDDELSKIEKACKIGDQAFEYILKKIKVGVTEKEIAEELENFIKKQEAEIAFPTIVAFGKNSSVPHHQTGNTKLGPSTPSGRSGQQGLFILVDFGVKFENYCSDMTRTVFFGKPSDKHKEVYSIVLEAQQKAVEFIKAATESGQKIKAKEVDKTARKYITSHGFPTIPHSLGHGIGLKVHEHPSLSPKSKDILKEGMVFSIEPGIYIPDFGGVRIEDLFVLEKTALRQLTTSPKEIIQL
ncbi:aminopeptidase P family protein [Candidatus Daviesbacteria bacterium]|nr:aminopeptidase P family protein [Candidatus Daviesbacteria bacterium]